jgi:hypothetical protein
MTHHHGFNTIFDNRRVCIAIFLDPHDTILSQVTYITPKIDCSIYKWMEFYFQTNRKSLS